MRSPIKFFLVVVLVVVLVTVFSSATQQQIFTALGGTADTVVNSWVIPIGGEWLTNQNSSTVIMPINVTFKEMYVDLEVASGGASQRKVTLYKNGAATSMTCYAKGATVFCSSNSSVSVTTGDNVTILHEPSGSSPPAASRVLLSFLIETEEDADLVLFGQTDTSTGKNLYMAAHGYSLAETTQRQIITLMPSSFTTGDLYIKSDEPHNASQSANFSLLRNGTTVIASCTIGNSQQTCSNLTAGATLGKWEDLSINITRNFNATRVYTSSLQLTSGEAGKYIISYSTDAALPNVFNPTGYAPVSHGDGGWTTTSSIYPTYIVQNFTANGIVVRQDIAASFNDKNYTIRKNAANTLLGCYVNTVFTDCENFTDISFARDETIDWEIKAVGLSFSSILGVRTSILADDNVDYGGAPPSNPCLYDCSVNQTISSNVDCLGNSLIINNSLAVNSFFNLVANITNWSDFSIAQKCKVINFDRIFKLFFSLIDIRLDSALSDRIVRKQISSPLF